MLEAVIGEGTTPAAWRRAWQQLALGPHAPIWSLAGDATFREALHQPRMAERFRAWLLAGSPLAGERVWRAALALADVACGHPADCPPATLREIERTLRAEVTPVVRDRRGFSRRQAIGVVGSHPGGGAFDAHLTVEALDAAGPQPALTGSAAMLFVPFGDSFREALEAAWTAAGGSDGDVDVRWSLEGEALTALDGGSMGLALGLVLRALLGNERLYGRLSATGALSPQGRVLPVSSATLPAKAHAMRAAGATFFLVPNGQQEEARQGAPGWDAIAPVRSLDEARRFVASRRLDAWIIDTSSELTRHLDAVNRPPAQTALLRALDDPRGGYVAVCGGSGSGKTAFLCDFIRSRPQTLAWHFLRRGMGDWDEPGAVLRSLYAQLMARWGLVPTPHELGLEPLARFVAALQRLSAARDVRADHDVVVVLDGLDEAFGPEGRLHGSDDLDLLLPQRLPPHVHVVVSTRGTQLDRFGAATISLDADRRAAVASWVETAARDLTGPCRRALIDISDGNFACAATLLAHVRALPPEARTAEALPHAADAVWSALWGRLHAALERAHIEPAAARALLGMLALARRPLSRAMLTEFLELPPADVRWLPLDGLAAKLDAILACCGEVLDALGDGPTAPLRFQHGGLAAACRARLSDVETREVHQLLANAGREWRLLRDEARRYGLDYGLAHAAEADAPHLVGSGLFDVEAVRLRGPEAFEGLLDAVETALRREPSDDARDALTAMRAFLRRRIHRLQRCPEMYARELQDERPAHPLIARWAADLAPVLPSRAAGPPTLAIDAHTDVIRAVALSPDGRRLATAGRDATIRVWRVAEPSTPLAILEGHQGSVEDVAFCDRHRLASAGADGTVRIWDVERQRAVRVMSGHRGHVRRIRAEGSRIVSGGDDGTVREWDGETGGCLAVHEANQGWIVALAMHGHRVASAGDDGSVRVWPEQARVGGRFIDLTYQDDVLCGVDGSPRVTRFGDAARDVGMDATALDGDVIGGSDGRICGTSAPLQAGDGVRAIRSGGAALAAVRDDGAVALWNASGERTIIAPLRARHDATLFAVSDDVLTASRDGRFRYGEFSGRTASWISRIACSGNRYAIGCGDGHVELWQEGARVAVVEAGPEWVGGLAFSDDGRRLAIGTDAIHVCDVGSPPSYRLASASWVGALACTSERVAAAGGDDPCRPRLWDLAGGAPRVLVGHTAPVTCLTASGGLLASGGEDGAVRLWRAADGHCLETFEGRSAVRCIALDATRVVAGYEDGDIVLWRLDGGREAVLFFDCRPAALELRDRTLQTVDMAGRALVFEVGP